MKIVLPIFLACEKLDWLSDPLRAFLEERLCWAALMASPSGVIVYTDSNEVEKMTRSRSIVCKRTDPPSYGRLDQRVAELLQREKNLADGPLVVLDYRAVSICTEDITRALEQYAAEPSLPVISLEKPKDHPVQFGAKFNVVGSGMVHLFSSQQTLDRLRQQFDENVFAASRAFPIRHDLVPAAEEGRLLLREEDGTGRMVWFEDFSGQKDGGSAYGASSSRRGPYIVGEDNGARIIRVHDYPNSVIRLMAFARNGVLSGKPIILQLEEGHGLLPPVGKDVTGYLYVLEDHVATGEFSLSTPLPGSSLLCAREIAGRQDFPEIYRYDGSLCVGSATQIGDMGIAMACGRIQGIELFAGGSLKIRSRLDMIRLSIWERSRGPEALAI